MTLNEKYEMNRRFLANAPDEESREFWKVRVEAEEILASANKLVDDRTFWIYSCRELAESLRFCEDRYRAARIISSHEALRRQRDDARAEVARLLKEKARTK
jgi:hypothetical protein